MNRIYVPMTATILVVGHIRLLKKLLKKGEVIIGLLTDKALKGYKKCDVSYKDRYEVLYELGLWTKIVSQETLDPYKNLKKYRCTHLASGDGFEPIEKESAKKLGVKLLEVNSGSSIHSSDIYDRRRT